MKSPTLRSAVLLFALAAAVAGLAWAEPPAATPDAAPEAPASATREADGDVALEALFPAPQPMTDTCRSLCYDEYTNCRENCFGGSSGCMDMCRQNLDFCLSQC